MKVSIKVRINGILHTEQQSVDLDEWTNRSWVGHKGRIEQFLRPTDNGKSALEELVGEKITKENTIFYVCGWQGTIDGTMDYLTNKNFVTEKNKREDGSFEVKFESYG